MIEHATVRRSERSVLPGVVLLLAGLLVSSAGQAAPHLARDSSKALEMQMTATLQAIDRGELQEAHMLARQMAVSFPRSSLSQLLAAEMATVAAHKPLLVADRASLSRSAPALGGTLTDLLLEARARLRASNPGDSTKHPAASLESLPGEIIQLGRDVSSLLVVDLKHSSMRQIEVNDGLPTLVRQHYVSSGKAGYGKQLEGDSKTPLGVYRINGRRSDDSLPELYGAGALTLDYPNALDRHLGRTGSGIWLHGVPRVQRNRAPRSSRGCVTMANDHFTHLQKSLELPVRDKSISNRSQPLVLLTHSTVWSENWRQSSEREKFRELFISYQKAWRDRDDDALLALYEQPDAPMSRLDEIELHDGDYQSPLAQVDVADVSMFHNPSLSGIRSPSVHPDERHFVVMRTLLGPESEQQLTLFWASDAKGQWKVVAEQWDPLDS